MTCTSMMAVILTDVAALGGALLRDAQPPVQYMTLAVAAALVGVSKKTITNRISEYKEQFDPPHYRRAQGGRFIRLITSRDLMLLREMHPIFDTRKPVNRKFPFPERHPKTLSG